MGDGQRPSSPAGPRHWRKRPKDRMLKWGGRRLEVCPAKGGDPPGGARGRSRCLTPAGWWSAAAVTARCPSRRRSMSSRPFTRRGSGSPTSTSSTHDTHPAAGGRASPARRSARGWSAKRAMVPPAAELRSSRQPRRPARGERIPAAATSRAKRRSMVSEDAPTYPSPTPERPWSL